MRPLSEQDVPAPSYTWTSPAAGVAFDAGTPVDRTIRVAAKSLAGLSQVSVTVVLPATAARLVTGPGGVVSAGGGGCGGASGRAVAVALELQLPAASRAKAA